MISEIAIFEASTPNVDLASLESPFKANLLKHIRTILAFDGARAAYYGQLIENPNIIVVVINWDTLDAHVEATKSPYVLSSKSSLPYIWWWNGCLKIVTRNPTAASLPTHPPSAAT